MSDPALDPHHRVDDPMPFLSDRAGFHALDLPSSLRRVRFLSKALTFLFILCIVAVAFLPWRQFVQGGGCVIAYNPLERTTTIEAPLAGRVQKSHVMEGQYVRQGDLLFDLTDNDPNLLANLQQQLQLARQRRDAAKERLEALNGQVSELERAMPLGIEAARARLDVARVSAATASQQFHRIESLVKDQRGLASQRDFELAQLDRDRTAADLARSEIELRRTEIDLRASHELRHGLAGQRQGGLRLGRPSLHLPRDPGQPDPELKGARPARRLHHAPPGYRVSIPQGRIAALHPDSPDLRAPDRALRERQRHATDLGPGFG